MYVFNITHYMPSTKLSNQSSSLPLILIVTTGRPHCSHCWVSASALGGLSATEVPFGFRFRPRAVSVARFVYSPLARSEVKCITR